MKKYGHFKSRLDELEGEWTNRFSVGGNGEIQVIFPRFVYLPAILRGENIQFIISKEYVRDNFK